jgi:hypothetical protein
VQSLKLAKFAEMMQMLVPFVKAAGRTIKKR